MRNLFFVFLLSTVLIWGVRPIAHAQDVPPPQPTGSVVTDQEAAILKAFFDKLNEANQAESAGDVDSTIGDIVADVIKTVNNSDNDEEEGASSKNESDDVSDDDSDEDDGNLKGKDKKKNKGNDKKKKKNKDKNKQSDKSNGRGNGLPPGLQKQLAKTGELPPGLQKKLEESGALPKGLRASGLPDELEAELPDLPEGQERVIVDNDILIIEQATGAVLDAIPDIIPPDLAPILNQLPKIFMDQQ